MKNNVEMFDEIIDYRRAIRVFDSKADFDESVIKRSIERAVLSPNSSNLQLWEFLNIKSPELKKDLAVACMGQNAAKTAQGLVVILVRRDLWKKRCETIVKQQSDLFKAESGGELTKKHQRLLKYWQVIVPAIQKSGFGVFDLLKRGLAFFTGLKKVTMREVTSKDAQLSAHRSVAIAAQTFMLSIAAEGYDSCPMEGFDSKRVRQILKLDSKAEIAMIIAVGKRAEKGVYGPRLRVPFEEVYFEK